MTLLQHTPDESQNKLLWTVCCTMQECLGDALMTYLNSPSFSVGTHLVPKTPIFGNWGPQWCHCWQFAVVQLETYLSFSLYLELLRATIKLVGSLVIACIGCYTVWLYCNTGSNWLPTVRGTLFADIYIYISGAVPASPVCSLIYIHQRRCACLTSVFADIYTAAALCLPHQCVPLRASFSAIGQQVTQSSSWMRKDQLRH